MRLAFSRRRKESTRSKAVFALDRCPHVSRADKDSGSRRGFEVILNVAGRKLGEVHLSLLRGGRRFIVDLRGVLTGLLFINRAKALQLPTSFE
jgi:hypothetical protein